MTDFLESDEVASRLGVSVRQVQRLARLGRIPHVRHGKLIRVPRVAWDEWLRRQSDAALSHVGKELAHA